MKVSIDRLGETSRNLLEGETIVAIVVSFVADRLSDDDQGFVEFRDSIAAVRQDTPVLWRPHPKGAGDS